MEVWFIAWQFTGWSCEQGHRGKLPQVPSLGGQNMNNLGAHKYACSFALQNFGALKPNFTLGLHNPFSGPICVSGLLLLFLFIFVVWKLQNGNHKETGNDS